MKLFVCMWILIAGSNANFFGIFDNNNSGGGSRYIAHTNGPPSHNNVPLGRVITLQVINEASGGCATCRHIKAASAPQLIRVIPQGSFSSFSGSRGGFGPAPKFNGGSASFGVSSLGHPNAVGGYGPASNLERGLGFTPTKVIRIIHEYAPVNGGSTFQQTFGAPEKIYRVLHESPRAQSQVKTAFIEKTSENNYISRVQNPQYNPPSHTFNAHESAPADAHIRAQGYGPPSQNLQYNPPSNTFNAHESAPVAANIPAQAYGPPRQNPQYNPTSNTLNAYESAPVAANIPAQGYGPPSQNPQYNPTSNTFNAHDSAPVSVHIPAQVYGPPSQ